MARRACLALEQVLTRDPKVKTFGLSFFVSTPSLSKAKACSNRGGLALEHASMALFKSRIDGAFTDSYRASASSVEPLRPKLTISRSRSASVCGTVEEEDATMPSVTVVVVVDVKGVADGGVTPL